MSLLFKELNSIINQYIEDDNQFEFTNFFHKDQESSIKYKKNNALIISNIDYKIQLDNYKNIYYYNQSLYDPIKYLEWCEISSLNENIRFDLIVNFLSPHYMQNAELLNFICNKSSKVIVVCLESSCLENLKKQLISLDIKFGHPIYSRINHFDNTHSTVEKFLNFKNLTVAIEELDLEYSNLQSFLNDVDNKWLFSNLAIYHPLSVEDSTKFSLELKFAFIKCLKFEKVLQSKLLT